MSITGNIGKRIVELSSCRSTNDFALDQINIGAVSEGDVIYTQHQLEGRGQKGNSWLSNPEENLICSIILEPKFLRPAFQFELTVVISVAIVHYLSSKGIKAAIKWPNDIYVAGQKIAGILIENKIKGTRISYSVIGIGLNINQASFGELKATSMKNCTGVTYLIYEELFELFQFLNTMYTHFRRGEELRSAYMELLLGIEKEILFDDGEQFLSKVVGVDEYGALILNRYGIEKKYGIKEVKFLNV